MQVDSCDDPHIRLTPLAPTVRHLRFEKLKSVEPKVRLRDLEGFPQDSAGLVLNHEKGAVGLSFRNLL